MCPVASQGNSSRHSFYWLSIKELCKSIDKQFASILFSAVFNAAARGKKPINSELEQHKLDISMLQVIPGLPVHITKNIAPKLGLANGSTVTVIGYTFPKGAIFQPMSF